MKIRQNILKSIQIAYIRSKSYQKLVKKFKNRSTIGAPTTIVVRTLSYHSYNGFGHKLPICIHFQTVLTNIVKEIGRQLYLPPPQTKNKKKAKSLFRRENSHFYDFGDQEYPQNLEHFLEVSSKILKTGFFIRSIASAPADSALRAPYIKTQSNYSQKSKFDKYCQKISKCDKLLSKS